MEAMCHTTKKSNFNLSGKEKINSVGRKISSMEERKKRGKERKGKERKEKKERKESNGVFLRPTTLRWSEFIGPKAKVCLRDASYAWVPKAEGFNKALKS